MRKSKKSSVVVRLERWRQLSGKTWDQIAADLEVNRSMLFHVLGGKRQFSPKALQRLEACEISAGIKSKAAVLLEQVGSPQELVAALLSTESTASDVTREDVDKGWKEAEVEFKGTPPTNCKSPVFVKAPTNAQVWQLMGASGATDNPYRFISACLPEAYAKPEVLDKLTPQSFRRVWETALDLTFGLEWRRTGPGH